MPRAVLVFVLTLLASSPACEVTLGARGGGPHLERTDAGVAPDGGRQADAATPGRDAYVESAEPDAASAPIDATPGVREDADRARDASPERDASAPDASRPPPPPIGALRCLDWPEQHAASDASWGHALTDLVRHLPRSYGDTYYDDDTVTYGHETSHGIHAHIRNTLDDTGEGANGLYLMDGRACLVREPRMRKSDVAGFVPRALRWSRFDLYITGSSDWDDTPLYVFDEWVAYTNGAEVGLDRASAGLWRSGWRGVVDGAIEFTVYAMAVGMAAEAREPGYFAREPNFRALLAYNARRAVRLFREGRVIPDFAWDEQDAFFERFRTSADAAEMRDWMRRVLGDEVSDELLAPL